MDGYFPPDSAIRRIAAESVLMLGGGRALLMQAADPLVAAGIVRHSGYRENPWRRLARTMTALYTLVFGSKAEADRAAAAVRAVHARVRGRIPERMGPYPAGTPYSAADPDLMMWVHATLVDTGLVMYETYVRALEPAEAEGFYRDMKLVARLFGTPAQVVPRTLSDFRDYLCGRLDSPEICVTEAARDVARLVLRPPLPAPLRPGLAALELTSVGLLPPSLREAYGFRWGLPQRAALDASARSVRRLLPLVPRPLRALRQGRTERAGGLPLALLAAFTR